MKQRPYLDLVQAYYDGCNRADRDAIVAAVCEDVIHYFTHHAPVVGAPALAEHWARMQPRIDGHWTIDHALGDAQELVIEWTLRWTPPSTGTPELMRGSEWYRFRAGRIAEIRAYYLNRHAPYESEHFELAEFPYRARGYTVA